MIRKWQDLYCAVILDSKDNDAIVRTWATYADNIRQAKEEFEETQNLREGLYPVFSKVLDGSNDRIDLNEYTIKYDYPVEHRKIRNYKGFQRRFVVQIKTTYVQEWSDYSNKYHVKEYSALNELRYAAAARNVTDARIVQILP